MIIIVLILLIPSYFAEICPRGYWPADVKSTSFHRNIGDLSSARKYNLPYGPTGNQTICRFCPGVSCFVVKLKETLSKTKGKFHRRPRPHHTISLTTTAKIPSLDDLFITVDNPTVTKAPDVQGHSGVQMSCARYADLPYSDDIVTYLDCVQIGQADSFYLFIYTPTNAKNDDTTVDCIDPGFLDWLPKKVSLRGLELGFPMRHLPPSMLRLYEYLMRNVEQVCIDSSALQNNEFDVIDIHTRPSDKLSQLVFRHDGLVRNRLPPEHLLNSTQTAHSSNEQIDECPKLTYSKVAKLYPDKDCRYLYSALPIDVTPISKEQIDKNCSCIHCTYIKPVIHVTRSERKLLPVPQYVNTLLNMALLALVLLILFITVLSFCIQNRDKAMLLFLTRRRKRRREMEEALLAEAAERAAKEAENAMGNNLNPFLSRYGLSAMSGFGGGGIIGYGPFAGRIPILSAQNEQSNLPETPAPRNAGWQKNSKTRNASNHRSGY